MKRKKDLRSNSGITLMTLVITVIILLILATVAAYSGIKAIENTSYTKFVAELKIMHTHVNKWYEECKPNENGDSFETNIANKLPALYAKKITEGSYGQDGKHYLIDSDELKATLGIEGVSQIVIVNIEDRKVISYNGLNYEGKKYFTLEQLRDGIPGEAGSGGYNINFYNVEYDQSKNTEIPVIGTIEPLKINNSTWKVYVTDVTYKGYTSLEKIVYQKVAGENETEIPEEKQTRDNYFIVEEPGNYTIKVVDTAGNVSQTKTISIVEE